MAHTLPDEEVVNLFNTTPLDGFDDKQLDAFIAFTGGTNPSRRNRRAPALLFPDQDKGRSLATSRLNNYAWNLKTARNMRASGNVQAALHYEAICERIYGMLPEWARW